MIWTLEGKILAIGTNGSIVAHLLDISNEEQTNAFKTLLLTKLDEITNDIYEDSDPIILGDCSIVILMYEKVSLMNIMILPEDGIINNIALEKGNNAKIFIEELIEYIEDMELKLRNNKQLTSC